MGIVKREYSEANAIKFMNLRNIYWDGKVDLRLLDNTLNTAKLHV